MEILELSDKKNKTQYIWVEKYRPKVLSEYLGNQIIRETFTTYIKRKDFCHIFLYGPPGTGKTTLAKLLVKEIPCDSIYINASNENGIDIIRDKISSFASSCGFKPLKVIILDEADYLTQPAQASLRPVMEMYAMNTRFILTGNYHEKISDPIKSRVQSFQLLPPPKPEVARHLVEILKSENITYTPETLSVIINEYYPDIRKIIQFCQQSCLDGTLTISKQNMVEHDIKNKILEMLRVRTPFIEIRRFIMEKNITRFEEIYTYLNENMEKFADGKIASVTLAIADAMVAEKDIANKQIQFVACIQRILMALK